MGRYTAHLVGESNYQPAVRRLRAGAPVTLEPEPGNRHDPRAIRAVAFGTETIGYVERDSWLTRAMVDERATVAARVHEIIGGEPGQMAGVVIEVCTAADAERVQAEGWPVWREAGTGQPAAPSHPPLPPPVRGKTIAAVAVVAVLLVVAASQCDGNGTPSAVAVAPARLSAEAVAQCRALLKTGEETGVIKARPKPTRINVDEVLWAQLPAEVKDRTLQAVACDVWQTAMPPDTMTDFVVAYGYRSGERIQMLTSDGMVRE